MLARIAAISRLKFQQNHCCFGIGRDVGAHSQWVQRAERGTADIPGRAMEQPGNAQVGQRVPHH